MGRFRFIHAADIHLGSMLSVDGAESSVLKQAVRDATYKAFSRICDAAVKLGVKFILISGDLYDREARSVRANRFFADACARLGQNGIEVFVIAGNHDPVREYQEMFALPSGVHIFRADEPEVYYVMDGTEPLAAIVGQSYKNKSEPAPMHQRFPVPHGDVHAIGMLHTQMSPKDRSYVPCTPGELAENKSIHYWALGHIHKPAVLRGGAFKGDKPVIAYSGTPQGRDFGEVGPGGCWLVEVDGTDVTDMQYLITSPVIYRSIPVDIGCEELYEADGLNQLEDFIVSYAQRLAYSQDHKSLHNIYPDIPASLGERTISCKVEGYVVRWVLTGRGRLHHYLGSEKQEYEQELCDTLRRRLSGLEPFVWTDSIVIRTGSPVTEELLEQHGVLKELLDQSIHTISSDDKVKKKLINELGQLWTTSVDPEDQDELKLALDDETLEDILEEAKQLLVENLVAGGD